MLLNKKRDMRKHIPNLKNKQYYAVGFICVADTSLVIVSGLTK
jgi:hypothetical protein